MCDVALPRHDSPMETQSARPSSDRSQLSQVAQPEVEEQAVAAADLQFVEPSVGPVKFKS